MAIFGACRIILGAAVGLTALIRAIVTVASLAVQVDTAFKADDSRGDLLASDLFVQLRIMARQPSSEPLAGAELVKLVEVVTTFSANLAMRGINIFPAPAALAAAPKQMALNTKD